MYLKQLDVMYTVQYDESSDTGTAFIWMLKMKRQDELKAEYKTPIMENCYIKGKLLDGTDCKVLFDTGASKSFMSKTFHFNSPSLHSLPNFVSRIKSI